MPGGGYLIKQTHTIHSHPHTHALIHKHKLTQAHSEIRTHTHTHTQIQSDPHTRLSHFTTFLSFYLGLFFPCSNVIKTRHRDSLRLVGGHFKIEKMKFSKKFHMIYQSTRNLTLISKMYNFICLSQEFCVLLKKILKN